MSLHSIKSLNSLKDPIKQFQVKFYISQGVSKILTELVTGENTLYDKTFELRCTSFTLPEVKFAQEEIVLGNHAKQIPTYQDRSGIFSVHVIEDVDASVLMGLHNWANRIVDTATGRRGDSSTYTSTVCIEFEGSEKHLGGLVGNTRKVVSKLYNKTLGKVFGETSDSVKLYLHGVYPIRLHQVNVGASSSEAIEWQIDFNVDWWGEDNTII